MPPLESEVARLRMAVEVLSPTQKLALVNEIILSTDDPACRLAVGLVARNAALVAGELERRAFVERDQRRRVVS